MTEEATAAAVAKLRVDLADVTSHDLRATQRAIGVCARHAVIDENKAQHVRPPLVSASQPTRRYFRCRLLLERLAPVNGYSR
jgi:hypothetical protein